MLLVLVLLGYAGFTAVQVWQGSTRSDDASADAIVVLGAAQYNGRPSPVLQARLDHAVTLYRSGRAPVVVVTGGRQLGDRDTEATAAAGYLTGRGVPDEVLLREVQGRSSWESLQATTRFLRQRDINTVLLVSDSFHNARILTMTKQLGLDPLVSPTPTSPITGMTRARYLAREVVALGLGRALGFGRLQHLQTDFSAVVIRR